MMSKTLLTNDTPLILLPDLAVAVGVNEALFLQELYSWAHLYQGSHGIDEDLGFHPMNSFEWIQKRFPFWDEATIRSIIANCLESKLIIDVILVMKSDDRSSRYVIDYPALRQLILAAHAKMNKVEA